MAKCDEGYRCDVCGGDVEAMADSDLYLRYVLGDVPLERLHLQAERHIHCHPALAQYIVADDFEPLECPGPFNKRGLAAEYVLAQQLRVTNAWRRLQQIPKLGLAIPEYPLHITPE